MYLCSALRGNVWLCPSQCSVVCTDRREIEKMGYTVSEIDKFVFVKQVGDRVFTSLFYVDDIPAVINAKKAERLKKIRKKLFGKVQFEVGNRMSYLWAWKYPLKTTEQW
jgi:hypothetical protein